MATIIEIDLDKNIIIPIKEPFNKGQLIDTLATYWGYDKGQSKTIRKSFKGTFESLMNSIENDSNINIIQNENGIIDYDITEKVPFSQKKTEWVISKYQTPATEAIIKILLEIQSKEEEENIQKEIAKIQADFDAKKNQIKSFLEQIRDVKLT